MTRFQQIGIGLRTFAQAPGFIFKNKLGWTFLVPVALNIILFVTGQLYIDKLIGSSKEILIELLNLDRFDFFGGMLGVLLTFLIEILFLFVFAFIAGYIIIILMSPLLAYLSEKTEEILTGKKSKTNLAQMILDILRGIILAVRNLFLELFFILLVFIAGFIPVIGWFAPVFLFLISSYYYGFSFIDYNNERKRLNISESLSVGRKYKWIAITNGAVFSISLLVPFCGTFVSLFVAIIAVVAAGLAMHQTNAFSDEPD